MWRQIMDRCSKWSLGRVLLIGLVAAFAFELLTVFMRFGLGLESSRETHVVGSFTLGIRIHHGYIGVALILVAWTLSRNTGLRNAMLVLGIGLFVSDMVHHFLVLWPVTGSPEFHLLYPAVNE